MSDLVAISWFLNKIEHSQAICSGTLVQMFTCTVGKSFPWSSAAGLASSRLSTAADTCSPSALGLLSLGGCWPWQQHQQPAHWGAFQGHRQSTCRQGCERQGLWGFAASVRSSDSTTKAERRSQCQVRGPPVPGTFWTRVFIVQWFLRETLFP